MFSINETINYGNVGVCIIADIRIENFAGKNTEYFVLKPVFDKKSTHYIPASDKALKAKMRRVMTIREIDELIKMIPEEKDVWIEDERERYEKFKEIYSGGNSREFICLIKTLYLHRQRIIESGKRLRIFDEEMLKNGENLIYEEFAFALKISPAEVFPYIKRKLNAAGYLF